MPSVIPNKGRSSSQFLMTIFHYISDVICINKQTMSNPRQEGPSTGLVAAAVLFVAFAAKDLFSEDTPGADDDYDADGGDDDSRIVCCIRSFPRGHSRSPMCADYRQCAYLGLSGCAMTVSLVQMFSFSFYISYLFFRCSAGYKCVKRSKRNRWRGFLTSYC